ncbi:MAG: hypothetical protein ACRDTO_01950 [Mycobacterium sp.]
MSENPPIPPSPAPPPPPPPPPKPDRLYRAAAWVAIVAGSLVIVLVVLGFVCAFWCCQ